jgi:signal transduction histidine kinase
VRLPRSTVRLRFALLYGGVFLLSGAALLGVTYVLTRNAADHMAAAPQPASQVAQPPPRTDAAQQQQAADLQALLVQSGIALGVMAVPSFALGWALAGGLLGRLRTITATARAISATNLHQRLALEGPDDELKELGDTFDGLLGRLEASFQAQRGFVANASHELRTPLARQRAVAQVALADPEATVDSLRLAHERALASGEQLERLIEALLTLARGQGGLERRAPFDLAAPAAEVLRTGRWQAEQQELGMRESLRAARADGDPRLVERLVANLVDNALRHNVAGGWIEVTTATREGRAILSVVNTGPVVPATELGRMLRPFQRLGADRVGRRDGLGLGLSIVDAIVQAHGAALLIEPRPEGGLRVEVTFPRPEAR